MDVTDIMILCENLELCVLSAIEIPECSLFIYEKCMPQISPYIVAVVKQLKKKKKKPMIEENNNNKKNSEYLQCNQTQKR